MDRNLESKISTTTINEVKIKPIKPLKEEDNLPIKGSEGVKECYANVLLLAKKMSGKTNAVWEILHRCVTKDTLVMLFVKSLYHDDTWRAIVDKLNKAKIPHVDYVSIYDDDEVNKLDEWVNMEIAKRKQAEEEDLAEE